MRLLTLNLHCRQEVQWLENLHILADFILENGVDVIALQEVAQPIQSPDLSADNDVSILKLLLSQRGKTFDAHWTLNHIGFDTWFEGLGLVSRYPFISKEDVLISKTSNVTDWQTRKAQIVTLNLGTTTFKLCNLHLGIEGLAIEELHRLYDQNSLENTILVGDFNIADSHPDYEAATALIGKRDIYAELVGRSDPTFFSGAHGWDGHTGKRIDYVFGPQATQIQRVFNGGDWPRISDHMGLLVDFVV